MSFVFPFHLYLYSTLGIFLSFFLQASDIPYSNKFGGDGSIDLTLSEYIEKNLTKNIPGGKHPWYVFIAEKIPVASEESDSLVRYEDMPTPHILEEAFDRLNKPPNKGKKGPLARTVFVNTQWAMGGPGTGMYVCVYMCICVCVCICVCMCVCFVF